MSDKAKTQEAAGDLCRVGAGVRGRCSEPNCLTFLTISEETSAPLLLPWKPSHLHHGDRQLEGSSLSGRRYLQGEEGKCPQTLLCCLRGSLGSRAPLCSGMRRHSRRCLREVPAGGACRAQCQGQDVLEEQRLEKALSAGISGSRPFSKLPLSGSEKMLTFSCLTNAGNLPGQPHSSSECASHLLGDLG